MNGPTSSAASARAACLSFVGILLLSAWALNRALPVVVPEKSHRNSGWQRDWLEYVRQTSPKQSDEVLVLLISNSQGFGGEVTEDQAYPCLLQQELTRVWQKPVRVVNWCLPSGVAPDFVLLAAAAQRLHPDVAISVLAARNFLDLQYERQGKAVTLSESMGDTRNLLALRDVRRALPEAFLRHYASTPVLANAFVAGAWRPWVFRDVPFSEIARRSAAGYFVPLHVRLGWRRAPLFARQLDRAIVDEARAAHVHPGLIRFYIDTMAPVARRNLLVAMPTRDIPEQQATPFPAALMDRWRELGGMYEDWSHVIANEQFLTYGHLDAEGHRQMARRLAERLGR